MYALKSLKSAKIAFVVIAICAVVWIVPFASARTETELPEGGLASSQALYTRHCSECHGTDGRAKTAKGKRAGATDFTSDWNTDEARGIRIITNGRDEMPSFKKKLTPQEIRSVFSYVLRFKK